jgi:hypothetical protein
VINGERDVQGGDETIDNNGLLVGRRRVDGAALYRLNGLSSNRTLGRPNTCQVQHKTQPCKPRQNYIINGHTDVSRSGGRLSESGQLNLPLSVLQLYQRTTWNHPSPRQR